MRLLYKIIHLKRLKADHLFKIRWFSSNHQSLSSNFDNQYHFIEFCENFPLDIREKVLNDFELIPDFISIQEENSLVSEIEPHFKRKRYLYGHWDNAIHGFREMEKMFWTDNNVNILNRVRKKVFLQDDYQEPFHIVDLAEDGFIKPHIDSVKFCGPFITGLSLLSESVMRFKQNKDDENTIFFDVMLSKRSLYIMKNYVRYMFSHEILKNSESFFRGKPILKKRRISVVGRSEVTSDDISKE